MVKVAPLRAFLISLAFGVGLQAQAPPAAPLTPPELEAQLTVEDGQTMVVAKAQRDQKPLAGAKVSFFVRRTFGEIKLGEDSTLEDGTAAVPLPKALPGFPDGRFSIRLQLAGPPEVEGIQKIVSIQAPNFKPGTTRGDERTLWARRAPVPLLLVLVGILALVWGSYGLVVRELFHLKKGDSHVV